jgi:hypothetical protein
MWSTLATPRALRAGVEDVVHVLELAQRTQESFRDVSSVARAAS